MTRSRKMRRNLIILLIVTLIFTFLPSVIVRLVLTSQLKQLGAEQVATQALFLNLWNGSLTVGELRASAPNRQTLAIGELVVNVEYAALFGRKLHLSELRLQNLQLPLIEDNSRWQVGPLLIPAPSEPTETETDSAPSEWTWGISNINFKQLMLALTYQQTEQRLHIKDFTLPGLYQWQPDQLSQLVLKGSLNDSEFDIDTQSSPLAETPVAKAQLTIDRLELEPLLKLWQPGNSGILSLDLQLVFAQTAAETFSASVDGSITVDDLNASQPALTAQAVQIRWQGRTEVDVSAGQLQRNLTRGTLNLAAVDVTLDSVEPDSGPLKLQTGLTLDLHATAEQQDTALELQQQADLIISGLQLSQTGLELSADQLRWQGDTQQRLEEMAPKRVQSNGTLSLSGLDVKQEQLHLQQQNLQLAGEMTTDLAKLAYQGNLSLGELNLLFQHLRIKHRQQEWQGKLGLDLANPQQLAIDGNYKLSQLALTDQAKQASLNLTNLSVNSFDVDSEQTFAADKLVLSDLVIALDKPLLELPSLQVKKVSASASATQIEEIAYGGLKTTLTLDEQQQPREWNQWITAFKGPPPEGNASSKTPAENETPPTDSEPPYPFKLGTLHQTAASTLSYADQRTKVGRPITAVIKQLDLANLNTRDSSATTFNIATQINRFGDVKANGEYTLFADNPSGKWQASIDQLELPAFSPYMNIYTGYVIGNGQLNLESHGTINKSALDSNTKVIVNSFEVEKGNPEEAKNFNGQLGMPLELAISILTDEDDNVTLDIPVNGSLQDPEFGIQSVVNILLGKIAKQGAVSYLTLALQPYGALLTLGKMAMDAAEDASVKLAPVTFEPGSNLLTTTGEDYLAKVDELLQGRKSLKLKLCGHAAADDEAYLKSLAEQIATNAKKPVTNVLTDDHLKAWLYQLAESRGDTVKSYLQEQKGVDGKRLFSCLPRTELTVGQPPRVEVGL